MSNGLFSEVRVAFQDSGNGPRISITGDPGMFDPSTGIPFRVYPSGCHFYTTVGTVKVHSTRQVQVNGEMLTFSKSNTATLQYPPSGAVPRVEVLWSLGDDGKPVGDISFKVNRNTGQVTASKPFTGLARTTPYWVQYDRILYTPEVQSIGLQWSEFPGLHVAYGVIAAVKDGNMATHEVQLPSGPQTGTDKVELWRVVSQTVIDPTGEWEKPQTWGPNYTGRYNDGRVGPSADSALVKERVHEIGYATRTGLVSWYDQFPRGLASPYSPHPIKNVLTSEFQPVISIKTQDPASLFDDLIAQRSAAQFIADRKTKPLIWG